jgi:hypothetical protein
MSRMSRKSRSKNYAPYRSKLEFDMATFLNDRGIPFKYEADKLVYYTSVRGGKCGVCGSVKGVLKKRYYVPDFTVGARILETKGRLTSAERTKFIALNEAYPGKIVLVFQRNNPIRKGSSTTYTDWAAEEGIRSVVTPVLPPTLVDELLKETGMPTAYRPPKMAATYKTKKSGPVMAGTKAKAKGKASGKAKKA